MPTPMRGGAYLPRPSRGKNFADLLENPYFVNAIRLFLVVMLGLGGAIWKAEMNHLNQALTDIKASFSENNRRQWAEVAGIREEVAQVNGELRSILHRTNQMLLHALERRSAGGRVTEGPALPPSRPEGGVNARR